MQPYKIKIRFMKQGDMRYFSQLDLTRVFGRALRRAGLPFYMTKGFRPRIKMSFGRALKVGIEGESEVTFYFESEITPAQLRCGLEPQIPSGLVLLDISPC